MALLLSLIQNDIPYYYDVVNLFDAVIVSHDIDVIHKLTGKTCSPPVILSAAKNLSPGKVGILRCAQNDRRRRLAYYQNLPVQVLAVALVPLAPFIIAMLN